MYINGATVTLAGRVAKEPSFTLVGSRPKATIRVAWSPRYRDRVTGEWKDGSTSFANVECWRNLANNVKASLSKGNAVVVTGRLRVREFEDKEGRRRISVEIDADSIGHDLSSGVTHLLPSLRRADGADGVAGADGADGAEGTGIGEQPDGLAAGEVARSGQDVGDAAGDNVPASDDVFAADAVAKLAGEMAEPVTAAAPF